MAYRNNFMMKNDRTNRISTMLNRLDSNLLSDLSSINSNYSSNNLLENYKYQNNYSDGQALDLDDAFDSNEDKPSNEQLNRKDVLYQLELERQKRRTLENKLKHLQTTMKKRQLHENEKLSNSLSLQNRRFDGDGSEDDLNPAQKTNLPKNKINYQASYQNNYRLNYQQQSPNRQNNSHLNDLNMDYLNGSASNCGLKVEEIDKLIRIIKQHQELNKNTVNDDSISLNSRQSIKQIKNNLINTTNTSYATGGGSINLDNQSLHSLDYSNTILDNDLYLNESNLKRQIINSMKNNFNSMIEFIENQSFSPDNLMAIQQLINLIMMQNCQFMNHQQVLLCWLQKLQLCTSSRTNHFTTNHSSTNNLPNASTIDRSIDATGDFNDNHDSTNHLNNLKSTSTLNNNQQIEPNVKTANNFYDNLKSHSSPMYCKNQLNTKMKNITVQNSNHTKLNNNKLNKNPADVKYNIRNSSELDELRQLIAYLIENKDTKQQNSTGKLNSYQVEFDEPGAVGGEDVQIKQISELNLNDLTDIHSPSKQLSTANGAVSHVNNNLNNNIVNGSAHLTNGSVNSSTVVNTGSTTNKSPQMIGLHITNHIPSSSNTVRKKVNTTNASIVNRKNTEVIIDQSLNMPDDLIKNAESIRPFSAAEGRSSDLTTMLLQANQVKVLNNVNNAKMNSTISSTTVINSNSIATPASTSGTNNPTHLPKRPSTLTGASRLNKNNFDDNETENETETDDDHQNPPEVNSSGNENEVTTNMSNPNQIVESSSLDPEQEIDEHFGTAHGSHLNSRNDNSEVRLSGDGEFQNSE